jgi:hypothetical protein
MRTLALLLALAACQGKADESPRQLAPRRPPTAPAAPAAPLVDAGPPPCVGHLACRGDDLVQCSIDGALGPRVQTCKDGCRQGACVDACATEGVELVYVLSRDGDLYSFDPRKLPSDPFHKIGAIKCGLDTPNSMAIDHAGIAWVVDHHSHLFRVSILDAHCTPAGQPVTILPVMVPDTFGMGFASNGPAGKRAPGDTSETLYVASDDTDGQDPSMLGRLDTATTPVTYTPIAPIAARGKWNPEFSGTGAGELFGYFPSRDKAGFIQQVDRATGQARGKRWAVPGDDQIASWAFAQWAGVFYVFATTEGGVTQVHAINRKTGAYKLARDQVPFTIVGAGVSTCAPELERAVP